MVAVSNLDWPDGFERTPEAERERTHKFQAGAGQTKKEIDGEMGRLEVSEYRLETGSGSDPGVVLRWRKDGRDHAVACDHYASKSSNLRAVYLWVNETRMRSDRPVWTGQDEFAAARLPSGDEDVIVADDGTAQEPHEVLGVDPEAPEATIPRRRSVVEGREPPGQGRVAARVPAGRRGRGGDAR